MEELNAGNSRVFEDGQGNQQAIAFECEINGRTFIITASKKIFEKVEGSYRECTEKDEETQFLSKYLKPPKSLDVIQDEGER